MTLQQKHRSEANNFLEILLKMDLHSKFLQFSYIISTLVNFFALSQSNLKEDSAEMQRGNGESLTLQNQNSYSLPTPPSPLAQNDKLANMGKPTDEEDFPEGFEIVDGIVMDISNVMVQFITGNATEYRFYRSRRSMSGNGDVVIYRRPKEEEGWHFILFEDPQEIPGSGHLVLLQKLLGLSVEIGMGNMLNRRELRLYEAYHVDLRSRASQHISLTNFSFIIRACSAIFSS